MQYGVLPAKIDIRDYRICSANIQTEFPEEFILDNLPKVKNQQNINSCCAHATSSILEYHSKNKNNLSTNFIYGIQKKLFNQCQPGMYLAQACSIAQHYGDMLEKDCPGNVEVTKVHKIAETAFEDKNKLDRASKYIIDSYYLCTTTNDIKYAIMTYGPVLGAVNWHERYQLDKDNVIYFDKNSDCGGHAIMVVGWNKNGWIIQNSWGKEFGNNGIFILPYQYGLSEARAIIDAYDEDDEALVQTNCKGPKWIVKIINWFINQFKKIKDGEEKDDNSIQ